MPSDLSPPGPNTGSVACPAHLPPTRAWPWGSQLRADNELLLGRAMPHKSKLQRSESLATIVERRQMARYGEGSP